MAESKQKIPAELQPKVAALNRAIFMRESETAARLYREILAAKPDYLLRPPVQYDLARLLEVGDIDDLAFSCYQVIIDKQPENSAYAPALKAAGHLAWKLQKPEECLEYLEAFLQTKPATPDRQDAEEILSRLAPTMKRRSKPEGEIPTQPDSVDIPSSGSWMTTDSGRPVTFEWSVKKKPGESSSSQRRGHSSRSSTSLPKLTDPAGPPAETPNPADMQRQYEFESDTPDQHLKPFRGSDSREVSKSSVRLDSDFYTSDTHEEEPQVRAPSSRAPMAFDEAPAAPTPQHRRGTGRSPAEVPRTPAGAPPAPAARKQAAPPPAAPSPRPTRDDQEKTKLVPEEERPAPIPKSEHSRVRVVASAKSSSGETTGLKDGKDPVETPEQRYDRMRDGQFALLLPFGKRIHLDAVAQLVSAREGIAEPQAKKLVLKRKGILYDKLTLSDVLELHPLVERCRQSLTFINVPRNLRPYEHYDVLSAEAKEPGLKMRTESAVRRIRWTDILLINAGNVGGEILVSILGSDPMKEYRFFEREFDYPSFSPARLPNLRDGLVEFLGVVSSNSTAAMRSHTVENLLKAKARDPQVFSIHEEYDFYTNWLLFSHYGEVVDSRELVEQSQVTSNW